jgi:heavy metal-binding protein
MSRSRLLFGLLATALAIGSSGLAQVAKSTGDQKLPPLSYVCTMAGDEDVIEDKPGTCRKCGMKLVPIRLDSVWTCPVHAAVIKEQPGKCPIDKRDLVQMTMSVDWVCPGNPSVKPSVDPGACPDGSPKQRHYSPRAHGNHNPQHGGGFFMAPDNWHHLEGAYFAPGVFRLYLYDDFTKPLAVAQVRAVVARILVGTEKKEVPLVRNGRVFEAKIGKLPFPVEVQARVKFEASKPENLFDFTFEKFSKDLPAPAAVTTSTAAPPASAAPAPAAPAPSNARVPGSAPEVETVPSSVDAGLLQVPIPETVPEMLQQLRARNDQIKTFIDRGAFAAVYVPAFQAKDVALALDAKKTTLPQDRQRLVGPAVDKLVRTAYLLDAFGDLGNKQQISDAYKQFSAAVNDIEAAFPKP